MAEETWYAQLVISFDQSAKLTGSDEAVIRLISKLQPKMLNLSKRETEQLMTLICKADILQKNKIVFLLDQLPKITKPDMIAACKLAISRCYELKKQLIRHFYRLTEKLYTPCLPSIKTKDIPVCDDPINAYLNVSLHEITFFSGIEQSVVFILKHTISSLINLQKIMSGGDIKNHVNDAILVFGDVDLDDLRIKDDADISMLKNMTIKD